MRSLCHCFSGITQHIRGYSAWTVVKDISKLQKHEIEAFISEPSKKSGDLHKGYKIALDPEAWLAEQEAIAQEIAELEENASVDQLDSEAEGEVRAGKSKKRKREPDVTSSAKAKARSKPKKTSEEPLGKKKSGTAKGRKNGAKSKAMIESEDEGGPEAEDEDSSPSKKPSSPVSKKAKRAKTGDDDGLFKIDLFMAVLDPVSSFDCMQQVWKATMKRNEYENGGINCKRRF